MKCDELESFTAETFGDGKCEVYDADEVNAAIDELKQKLEDAKASAYAEMVEQAGNVLDGVVRLKERIAELEEERRWRKFPDEKPVNGQEVLVWLTAGGTCGFVLTSSYIDSQWYYGEDPQGCKPSHWMPLPSAPKEGE